MKISKGVTVVIMPIGANIVVSAVQALRCVHAV